MTRVDAVIVTYNGETLVESCVRALRDSSEALTIITVDNASEDGSAAAARKAGADRALENEVNVGFGSAVNRGVAAGTSPYVLLVNSDAEVAPDTATVLAGILENDPKIGAAGPRIESPDGELELSVGRTMTLRNEAWFKLIGMLGGANAPLVGTSLRRRYEQDRDVTSLTAACLMIRREAFNEVGGFDEAFFLYAEDVDLCRRLREAGWRLRYCCDTAVRHIRGATTGSRPAATERAYRHSQQHFYAKHHGPLARATLRCYLEAKAALGSLLGSQSARHLRRWLRDGAPRPGGTA